MKIAVIADTHLGFSLDTERGEDSFRNAAEAFHKAIARKPDLILLLGDIFHDRVPKPEIIGRAIDLLKSVNKKVKKAKVNRRLKGAKDELLDVEIPAIVSIYGTHEMRNVGNVNPIQLLEKAGLLVNMHAESLLIEAGGEKIGLHGMSGVPDKYAREAIQTWNPKKFDQVTNIGLFHQTFKELIPEVGQEVASFSDLPAGFDLYLLGHIHWNVEDFHPAFKTPILVPGSTVRTQLRKIEGKKPKGFYIIETGKGKLNAEFITLESIRKFYYELMILEDRKPSEIIGECSAKIKQILEYELSREKPLIRFKFRGKLAEGFLPTDLNFSPLIKDFKDKSLLFFDKSSIESAKLSEKAKLLLDLKNKKLSIEQLGMQILLEKLKPKDSEDEKLIEQLFSLLAEDELDKAEEILR